MVGGVTIECAKCSVQPAEPFGVRPNSPSSSSISAVVMPIGIMACRTRAESEVPMLVNMPGPSLVLPAGQTNPVFVTNGFNGYVAAALFPDGHLRSYQLPGILATIIGPVRTTRDPAP